MTYPFESFGNQASKRKIQSFEKTLGVDKLPSDYREFLLLCNGGFPTEKSAFNFYDGKEGSLLSCMYALGLDANNFSDDLSWIYQEYSVKDRRLPKEFIFIGSDAGGNQIALGISGEYSDQIWFWNHEEEANEGEEPDMSNMILVANSFKEFIDGLYEYKLEHAPSLYERFMLALRNNWEKVFPPR